MDGRGSSLLIQITATAIILVINISCDEGLMSRCIKNDQKSGECKFLQGRRVLTIIHALMAEEIRIVSITSAPRTHSLISGRQTKMGVSLKGTHNNSRHGRS